MLKMMTLLVLQEERIHVGATGSSDVNGLTKKLILLRKEQTMKL